MPAAAQRSFSSPSVSRASTILVLLGREHPVQQAMDAAFRRGGARAAGRVEVHSVATACALVAEGLGVTVATRFMALLFGGPAVEMRPFRPEMHSACGIISTPGSPLSNTAEHFVAELATTLKRRMAPADQPSS